MLAWMSADDPPLWMKNGQRGGPAAPGDKGHINHHPAHVGCLHEVIIKVLNQVLDFRKDRWPENFRSRAGAAINLQHLQPLLDIQLRTHRVPLEPHQTGESLAGKPYARG